ncbi:MAG: polysaccharide biosynthesis tyrosine autokinase [Planctomycetota bacterium]
MEFKEYLAIIRRRWLLFFPIFVLIVGVHLTWVTYTHQNRFAATSKVIIGLGGQEPGAEHLPVNPFDSLSLLTKENTITDYPVLKRAAQLARGDVEFESPEFKDSKFPLQIEAGTKIVRDRYGENEEGLVEIISLLRAKIQAAANQDRQIVDIRVEGDTELTALLFSWAVCEGATQFHNQKSRESHAKFLEKLDSQIAAAEVDANQTAADLALVKERSNVANLEEKERVILSNLYHYEDEDSKLVAQERKNDKMISYRLQQASFDARSDLIDEAKLATSRQLGEIRGQLFAAKLEYETALASLSPEHPTVKQQKQKIEGLKRAAADEQDNLLTEKYRQFSKETNELIKENSFLELEREVYSEQRQRLKKELQELASLRAAFAPREVAVNEARDRLQGLRTIKKDVQWRSEGRLGSVIVYDPAYQAHPVTPAAGGAGPLTLTVLMAFIFALGVVYIAEYLDTRVKNEHDVRRHLNLPLLGIIPKEAEQERLLIDAPLQSEISEKFNTAATLIQSTCHELKLKALMVCSAIAREGKTTVSINIAVALARKGARVVLIDGDLRISQIHNCLRLSNNVGLSTALDTRVNQRHVLEGALTESEIEGKQRSPLACIQRTSIENLDVLTSGPSVADPVLLLEHGRLNRLVGELKKHYDFVIFDTPPINKVGDALTISAAVDGSLFVVGSGQAEQQEVTWAKHLLTNVQSNILGVFLNKFVKQRGGEYYYYYYYNDRKRKRVKSRA